MTIRFSAVQSYIKRTISELCAWHDCESDRDCVSVCEESNVGRNCISVFISGRSSTCVTGTGCILIKDDVIGDAGEYALHQESRESYNIHIIH